PGETRRFHCKLGQRRPFARGGRTRRLRPPLRALHVPARIEDLDPVYDKTGVRPMALPILPTTMVGSYAMPGWLERLKTEYFARRISRQELDEIHDTAVKAAIKDQEIAGLDIVTDGEPRRDNMVDYFLERFPGVQIDRTSKKFYYDFYDRAVKGKLPMASLGLVQDFKFLQTFAERETKFCVTGPHCLVKRIRNEFYPSEEALAMDIARVMNMELKALAKAGRPLMQIDEPYYSGFPEDLPWAV